MWAALPEYLDNVIELVQRKALRIMLLILVTLRPFSEPHYNLSRSVGQGQAEISSAITTPRTHEIDPAQ